MSSPLSETRRRLLQGLAGAPLLPLGGVGCTGGGSAGGGPGRIAPTSVSASFIGMAAPSLADPAAMATLSVGSGLRIDYSDGSRHTLALAWQPFFTTGERVPDGTGGTLLAGGCVDIQNRPIIDRSLAGQQRQVFSDCPDGSSLLALPNPSVAGIRGRAVFAVVQFEYTSRNLAGADTYGQLPSPVAVLTLDQNPADGALTLVKYHNVDTSAAHGLWITCGASLSPWGTHLASEEYEPDAPFAAGDAQFRAFSRNLFGDESAANPYHYGHLPEITVNPDGSGTCRKHYGLGRISHELIQVMPDNRTALMGDDHTNAGLFMFVADREKDLSAGTLYVAKVGAGFSLDPAAPGAALSWIRLGHATSAEIEHLADTLKPADILDVSKTDPNEATWSQVFVDGVANWVRLRPGMEKAAAFLETHRYAGLVGASMGFTKLEGTTVNVRDKIAYSALQNIEGSMVRGASNWRESSGITVDRPVRAGGIFAHDLAGGQTDSAGVTIASDWVPVRTRALLIGEDRPADALGNLADPDRIASPDNLKFSERLRTLFVGEDSGSHVNNFLWAYNVDSGTLARLASMPAGAESTGLQAVDELNGWTYIVSSFQHPGDWSRRLHGKVQATLDPLVRANYRNRFAASVGYLTADVGGIRLG